jgi:carbon storage regulator
MLVLTRRINETVLIGSHIRITAASIRGRHVRLAIEAPADVRILREELVRAPRDHNNTGPGVVGPPFRGRVRRPPIIEDHD